LQRRRRQRRRVLLDSLCSSSPPSFSIYGDENGGYDLLRVLQTFDASESEIKKTVTKPRQNSNFVDSYNVQTNL
ncbi:hypothetical protein Ccrd_000506, partial [Cynara cardunculus var. scolymus]